jgi:hypothetical protein
MIPGTVHPVAYLAQRRQLPQVQACMTEWAQDLSIEPEQVEQLIFRGN